METDAKEPTTTSQTTHIRLSFEKYKALANLIVHFIKQHEEKAESGTWDS